MGIFHFQKRSEFLPVYLIIITSLLLIMGGSAALLLSVLKVRKACLAVDSLFQSGDMKPEESQFLENLDDRTVSLFFKNYSEAEKTAAALLLHEQREDTLAELFLLNTERGNSPLSLMGRDLLLNIRFDRQNWDSAAVYAAERIRSGERDEKLLNSYFEAAWKGRLSLYPDISADSAIPWSLPFLHKQGLLSPQEYYRFLLEEDPVQIKEILRSWSSPYDKDEVASGILNARILLEQKEYRLAEPLLNTLWTESLSLLPSLPESFLLELRETILRSGRGSFWLEKFENSALPVSGGFAGAFLRASLYEEAGKTDSALAFYQKARSLAGGQTESMRAQWYELRLLIRHDPEEVPGFLNSRSSSWGSTDYFDDLIDEYFSLLVRSRAWTKLEEAVALLAGSSLEAPLAQGILLLDRAVQADYLEDPDFLTDSLRRRSRDGAAHTYYALIEEPRSWPYQISGRETYITLSSEEDALDEVYRILLQAGESDLCWYLWNNRLDSLSYETVETFCSQLFRQKNFYQCIRFAGYWFYRWPSSVAVNLIPWLYPVDSELSVASSSRESGQPEELILGVIRRESAFHRTIESRAGAMGLMQIMPSTASDLASRYRVDNWDLLNPDDNIRLGSMYLQWLCERPWTGNYSDVLAAYNGGGGNLRRWKRQMGDLDEQLFIQAIPYSETRNYIRKVIVAAGAYRYLNTGTPPGNWISLFFDSLPLS